MLELISKWFLLLIIGYSFLNLAISDFDVKRKPSQRLNQVLSTFLAATLIFGALYYAGVMSNIDFWNK